MKNVVLSVYRVRQVVLYASILVILVGTVARQLLPAGPLSSGLLLLPFIGFLGLMTSLFAMLLATRILPQRDTITVVSPVSGRWLAVNSPATKVPSHGVRAYGQAYAVDLVYEPTENKRPAFGAGESMRSPQDFPAFGEPVRAMVDGVVVTAIDSQRDHRSRSSWVAFAYMMLEGAVRELGGPRFIVGNHIVVRADDGVYGLVAHLQRGSALVRAGEQVTAGQIIAQCGNSGNSTEPHVHAQLMDRASLWTGQGIDFAFADVRIGDDTETRSAMPATGEHLTATV